MVVEKGQSYGFRSICETEISRLEVGGGNLFDGAMLEVGSGRRQYISETVPALEVLRNNRLDTWQRVLTKVDAGTVSRCDCGDEIPIDRLRLMLSPDGRQRLPVANCVRCQQQPIARNNLHPRDRT